MKKQSNNSMLQAICALIIMIGYFLPWVQASVLGEPVFSFSFMEFIANTEKLSSGLSDYASVFSYNIRNYALLLYVIPLLTLIGAMIQWIGKYPDSVHFCPHCGCDLKKAAEEKQKEDDNQRFAPPQYRGEN